MAIATLPTTRSEIEIVFTCDPDVKAKDPADKGWIPRADADASPGADILTVAPMGPDQRAQSADAKGMFQRGLVRTRAILRRVNGSDTRAAMEEWIHACPENAILLLGLYGDAITDGEEPQPAQRDMFRLVPGIGGGDNSEE